MKKTLFALLAFASLSFSQFSVASYRIDENAIDMQMAAAEDVSMEMSALSANFLNNNQMPADEKTVGGFLLRAYFCGNFALHRYYMGTGGAQLFWYYFCIPVVGGGTACIDFWYVVFKGKEGLSKYENNSNFWVWN